VDKPRTAHGSAEPADERCAAAADVLSNAVFWERGRCALLRLCANDGFTRADSSSVGVAAAGRSCFVHAGSERTSIPNDVAQAERRSVLRQRCHLCRTQARVDASVASFFRVVEGVTLSETP